MACTLIMILVRVHAQEPSSKIVPTSQIWLPGYNHKNVLSIVGKILHAALESISLHGGSSAPNGTLRLFKSSLLEGSGLDLEKVWETKISEILTLRKLQK